jgi:tetratricopeptide (TPR) repeat protein
MERAPQDHLHRLIQKMTPAEKRYFKLNTARHGSKGKNIHHVLFDAMAGMESYDEGLLLACLEKPGPPKDFVMIKHRLHEAVLRSLAAFHTENSVDARLARMLHQVEILHQKSLYEDAERLLTSARKLARAEDRQPAMLAITRWEQRLLERNNYANADAARMARTMNDAEQALMEETELNTLWKLKSAIFQDLYRDGQAREQRSIDRIKRHLEHPILRDRLNNRSTRATFLLHHLSGAATFAIGDLQRCSEHLSRALNTITSNKERFLGEANLALSTLSNLAVVKMRLGRSQEALELLNEFRALPERWDMPRTEDLELKLFVTSSSLELTILSLRGDFQKALELQPLVERGLATYGDRIGPMRKAAFYYQLGYIHLGAGDPRSALRWTHRLLNEIHIDESAEIVCFGRVLDLLALVDARKLDLASYASRNTGRFLMTRKRMHRFEAQVLRMVRGVIRSRNGKAVEQTYLIFKQELQALEKDPLEQVVFEHMDPLAWVESKLSGRLFGELVQERTQRALGIA